MRISAVVLALLTCSLTLAAPACGGNSEEGAYDTLQLCFDDHHNVESLPAGQSITICCLEHPIGGVTGVCGTTAAACEAYVGTSLTATSATPAEITAGCADYVAQRGQ